MFLTPHLLYPFSGELHAEEIGMLCVGVYNGGMIGVGLGSDGIRFLDWWMDRVSRYAYDSREQGVFTDQKWLDLVPCFFKDVQISRSSGLNLGHWRVCSEKDFALNADGKLTFCGEPVTLMHMSGFKSSRPNTCAASETLGDYGLTAWHLLAEIRPRGHSKQQLSEPGHKRIYIAGCGGMLGAAFYEVFKAECTLKCTDIDVNAPWLSYMDIRDLSAYRKDVTEFQPDYLFHLGACTDMEDCERDPDNAWLTNTIAVENAVYIANELNIPLLYIGTAGIFDGRKQQFDDWDLPNPISCYARSKYAGEVFVREHVERHLVSHRLDNGGVGRPRTKNSFKKSCASWPMG